MLFLFSVTWGAVSGWWTPVCLLLGVLYAWLLYRQPANFDKTYRYILFGFRAILVFLIAFLLIAPLIRTISYKPEKPLILIAQDNSESVKLFKQANYDPQQLMPDLAALKQSLGDQYDVRTFHFGKQLNDGLSNRFNEKHTDITAAINQLNDRFVNQNIGAIIMATDGLYNQGSDPQYEAKELKTNIYTIALGDTIPRRDLLIANVNYNKTSFLGNDFEIEVLATAYQSKGETMHLTVTENGRQVNNENIPVTSAAFKKAVTVKLNADKKGICKYTINIATIKNEISVQNNTETIYVEVLDARQKILLVCESPHPDIAVIKQAIESNKNYEVKVSPTADLASIKLSDYSLVILYQVSAQNTPALNSLMKGKTPVWYMLGAQTNLQAFNYEQKSVAVEAAGQQMQEVFAQPQSDFSAFTLSDSTRKKISLLPPLLAPFGTYSMPTNGQILLKQRIGNVNTNYPLLTFSGESGRRTAVLTGEGLWRWQLSEYQTYSNHHAIEELLSQAVQYLTANADRKRFRAYPANTVFDEGENVILNAELYNEALELVNTPDVSVDIKNQQGKNYSFLFTRTGKSYQLDAGILPAGEYNYKATAVSGKQNLTAAGQFTIKALNLEARQSAANHQLLYIIAKQSGGQMLMPSQISKLADLIRKNENIKTVVYEDKRYGDLIDSKWLFALILSLLTAEWFMRKREGEV